MTTYSESEISAQGGRPVLLFTIELPAGTWRLTNSPVDVTFASILYAATPIGAGSATQNGLGKVRELTVSIPINHALASALRVNGIPPRYASCTVVRIHIGATGSAQKWNGYIESVQSDGPLIRLSVLNQIDDAFSRSLPIYTASRTCQHMLYDPGTCGIDRSLTANQLLYKRTTTIATVSGTTIRIVHAADLSTIVAANALVGGEIVRLADGERRSILAHVFVEAGATDYEELTIDCPFPTLTVGDTVEFWFGCDRTVATCKATFSNVLNFGGHPDIPETNPLSPTGGGMISIIRG